MCKFYAKITYIGNYALRIRYLLLKVALLNNVMY